MLVLGVEVLDRMTCIMRLGTGQAELIVRDDVSDDAILKTIVNAGYTATEVSSIPKSN